MSDIKQKLVKLEEIRETIKVVNEFLFEMYANVKHLELNEEFQDNAGVNNDRIQEEAAQYRADINKCQRGAEINSKRVTNQIEKL